MSHKETQLTEQFFERWRAGDALAQEMVYQVLKRRFLWVAQKIIRDPVYAEESLHDAFLKLDRNVREGRFCWQGQGSFYAYANTAVRQAALDLYRRIIKGKNAQYEADHRFYGQCDDEADIEYVEQVADEDWLARLQEEEMRNAQAQILQQVITEYFKENPSDRDRQIWEACLAWANTPGGDQWSPQPISAFLKGQLADLGLSDSAFYTALSRLKAKLTHFRDQRSA